MMDKTTTIQGIVTPCEWDSQESVTSVAISTHTEEEFLVDTAGMGRKLLDNIRQFVHVTGVVTECENGGKRITVETFKVIDTFAANND